MGFSRSLASSEWHQEPERYDVNRQRKKRGIDRLVIFFEGSEKELTPEKLYAQEILWRVEERLWVKLEEKHGGRVWRLKKKALRK